MALLGVCDNYQTLTGTTDTPIPPSLDLVLAAVGLATSDTARPVSASIATLLYISIVTVFVTEWRTGWPVAVSGSERGVSNTLCGSILLGGPSDSD